MTVRCRRLAALALGLGLLAGCAAEGGRAADVALPEPDDWVGHGPIIRPGPEGAWDHRTTGALSPASLIEVPAGFGGFTEDSYILYYIGASGDRADGGPAYRKLGVATSVDGRNWTKYQGNPVLAFDPQPDHVNAYEAGVFSAAAWYDDRERKIYLLYGAMTPAGSNTVDIAVRLATSTDGYSYTDQGEIIPANGPGWPHAGSRDAETFPVGLWRTRDDRWLVWYSAKNVPGETWAHYFVSGQDLRDLRAEDAQPYQPRAANPLGGDFHQMSVVQRAPDGLTTFALAYDEAKSVTRLHAVDVDLAQPERRPAALSAYPATWPTKVLATLHLDVERGEWLMIHQTDAAKRSPLRLSTTPVR